MKSIFYNPKLAEKESKEKRIILEEQEQRNKYFTQLLKNRLFQKYVMQEIIESEIADNSKMSDNVEAIIKVNPEEYQRTMIAKAAALKTVKNIKNKIMMN